MKIGGLARALLYSVLGLGVAGNGYYAYQNSLQDDAQAASITELTQDLEENQTTIRSLNELLQNERTTNEHQAKQMGLLQTDLSSRITLDQITHAISSVTPSTVQVQGEHEITNHFTGETIKRPYFGSGMILVGEDGNRYIITNGHITQDAEIKNDGEDVGVFHITLYNGSDYSDPVVFDARPVLLEDGERAFSPPDEHDLAVLAIPKDVELPPNIGIRFRDLSQHPLQVGEPVFAVGSPFGERDSVTTGSISHTDRAANGINQNRHVQTDTPINPGNSGGGLFSIRVENGEPVVELVGINTWGYRADGVVKSIRVDYIQNVLSNWGIEL